MKKVKFIFCFFIFIILFSNFSFSFAAEENLLIYSPSVILIEESTGKIIYEKNAYDKMYPASTTKIMTAILTLEHCSLTDTAIVSQNAVNSIPYSYSTAYLKIGEELTIYQLLNVLLIASANDAAIVLAEHISGSVESFCSLMNTKAVELGCLNTNFVNPNGVHNENHYSTAYDLALISQYAMKNETFRQFVTTLDYTLPATNKYVENNRYFVNTNLLLHNDTRDAVDNYYYSGCTGIKTGYTDSAKDCIVASVEKDGIEFIAVILGADKTSNGLSARYLDCKTLFNYATSNYSTYKINEENAVLKQIDILNATKETKTIDVIIKDEINLLIKNSTDTSSIVPKVDIDFPLNAPIIKNTVIGEITYDVDGITYTSPLLCGSDVEESDLFNLLFRFLLLFIVIFLLYIVLKQKKQK